MRKHSGPKVFRITGARAGLADDVKGRQRRYVISMSVRTVSFLLAVALWNIERHVAIVALVLGFILPYIAVVIANAGRENAPSVPDSFIATPVPPMLESDARSGPPGQVAEQNGAEEKERSRDES
ncbi:DUF3099 domain-containing protein [Streptomyces sp. NPDC051776]|uniref:DUF3099 domain-containing protein n=1 Tax=Streptomyces sp. NPDC051776 TaxID=3155414 RepID=UPI0034206C98